MIYGQYGSGKTNSLLKLCYHKLKEDRPEQKLVLISANYCTMGQNFICQKFCEIINIQFESRLKENLTDLLVIILLKKYKDLNKYQNLENY